MSSPSADPRQYATMIPSGARWPLLLVGRAWNNLRCKANLRTFAEFAASECLLGAVNAVENERLPLAVTRFDREA